MKKFIKEIISLLIGIALFIIWMNLVGNPHVIETILGLAVSIIIAGFVYSRLRKI